MWPSLFMFVGKELYAVSLMDIKCNTSAGYANVSRSHY